MASISVPRLRPGERWEHWIAWRRLVRLSDQELRRLLGVRLAKVYAFVLVGSYWLMMLVLRDDADARTLDLIAFKGTAWAGAICGGLASLSIARQLPRLEADRALEALAAQHGYGGRAFQQVRLLSAAYRINSILLVPALLLGLAALGLTPRVHSHVGDTLVPLLTSIFALSLGTVLALLSVASVRLSPRHPGLAWALFIFGPELSRSVWENTPSVMAVFSWWLEQLIRLGAV